MNILVTFAVPQEFAPWRARQDFWASTEEIQPESWPRNSYEGTVGDNSVRVLLTGIGGRSAAFAMHHWRRELPDFCVSAGLAGGLSEFCRVGDVVVARKISALGTDAHLASNPYLVAVATACGAKSVNISVTSQRLVIASKEKRAMSLVGDVVEMESYFVLRAAADARVPAVAIRAISDEVEEDLPMDFSRVTDENGQLNVSGLVGRLVRHPREIPSLMRFARRSRRATGALADFLDSYIPALGRELKNAKSMALREVAVT